MRSCTMYAVVRSGLSASRSNGSISAYLWQEAHRDVKLLGELAMGKSSMTKVANGRMWWTWSAGLC
jgi:hypothetical protein